MCTPHRAARTPRLSERTRVRYHEPLALPLTAARGKGAGSDGLPGQGQGTRVCARLARAEPHTRRHRTDPGCVEVVGLPLGPRRPVHTDPPTARAAPAT